MSTDHDLYERGGVHVGITEGGWGARLSIAQLHAVRGDIDGRTLRYSDDLLTLEDCDRILKIVGQLRERFRSEESEEE